MLREHQRTEQMPHRAQSLDNWGKRFWRPTEEERERARRTAYVGAIVVNLVLVIVAHNLLSWRVPFITPTFADVLWAIDLSLGATVIANLILLGYDASWFRHLVQITVNGCALVSSATLYGIFPFDFGEPFWNDAARLALLVVMLVLVVTTIVQAILVVVDLTRRLVRY